VFEVVGEVLIVRGECDCDNALQFAQRIAELGGGPVQLDMGDVTFFDSASLRVVLLAHQHNPELRVVNPSRQVHRVLEITATLPILCPDV